MKMPELAATKTVVATLIGTIALLAVAAVAGALTVGGSRSSSSSTSHPAAGTKAATSSKHPPIDDVCTLVTPKEASAAFGADAGAAHLVLNACLYDNGTHKLIVALTRESIQAQFDAGHGSTAKDVPDVGDRAYVQDGRLKVLKGSYLMMLTLLPADPAMANSALVTLGKAAAPRL